MPLIKLYYATADVLLMRGKALTGIIADGWGHTLINKVRQRVGMPTTIREAEGTDLSRRLCENF